MAVSQREKRLCRNGYEHWFTPRTYEQEFCTHAVCRRVREKELKAAQRQAALDREALRAEAAGLAAREAEANAFLAARHHRALFEKSGARLPKGKWMSLNDALDALVQVNHDSSGQEPTFASVDLGRSLPRLDRVDLERAIARRAKARRENFERVKDRKSHFGGYPHTFRDSA